MALLANNFPIANTGVFLDGVYVRATFFSWNWTNPNVLFITLGVWKDKTAFEQRKDPLSQPQHSIEISQRQEYETAFVGVGDLIYVDVKKSNPLFADSEVVE